MVYVCQAYSHGFLLRRMASAAEIDRSHSQTWLSPIRGELLSERNERMPAREPIRVGHPPIPRMNRPLLLVLNKNERPIRPCFPQRDLNRWGVEPTGVEPVTSRMPF